MPEEKLTGEDLLLHHARQGEQQAFRALYEQYAPRVYAFLVGYTGDPELAKDLVQETFLKVWQALPSYQEQGVFLGWVLRIAQRLAIDAHRRRRPEVVVTPASVPLFLARVPSPEDHLLHQERWRGLRAALEALPPDYRMVLVLRFLMDYSVRETARLMQRPEVTVRVLQHRALQALRKALASHAGASAPQLGRKWQRSGTWFHERGVGGWILEEGAGSR